MGEVEVSDMEQFMKQLWTILLEDPFVQLSVVFMLGTWIALILHWRERR